MFYNATAFDQNLGSWNVTSATLMSGMFNGVTLSTDNYDALLIGWAAQSVQDSVTFDGGNSNYSCGTAETARATLTNSPNEWTITDGGLFDDTDPEIPTLDTLTGECSVTAVAPTTTDNCAGTITGTTSDPLEYTVQGTYIITWNFDDSNENSIDVEQTIVVDDVTAPTITCLEEQTVDPDNSHTYTVQGTEFDPIEAFDNCGIASIKNDLNNASTLENAQLPEGTTTIVWTVTDNAGNTEICSFDVVVNLFVGVENLQQSDISIYPNPTQGALHFDFTNIDVIKITVSDITGQVIIEKAISGQFENINLSNYVSGVYIINIQAVNKIYSTKIIKK